MKREGRSESVSGCKEERGRKPEGRVARNEKDGKGRAGKWEREGRRGSKVERRGRESGGKNQ